MSKGSKENPKKVYNSSRHILPEVVAGGEGKKKANACRPCVLRLLYDCATLKVSGLIVGTPQPACP